MNTAILFLDERRDATTLAYLAQRIGISRQAVNLWWLLRKPIPVKHLNALAEALDMTEDERRRLHWLSARDHGFDV